MIQFSKQRWILIGATAYAAASTCSAPLRAAQAGAPAAPVAPVPAVPGLAAGWPVTLHGAVIGAPVAADLDGDGKLEVVASAMKRFWNQKLASPDPTIAVQLWGFRADATGFPGWPVTVKSEAERQAMHDDTGFRPWADNWYASPSVWDVNDDGASEIILNTAGHGTNAEHGNIMAIYADGGRVPLAFGSSDWATTPLADLDGDGIPDIVLDKVVTGVNGQPVRGWPLDKRPASGYQSATGDADGDGRPEVFMPSSGQEVWGLGNNGEPLPGWPRKVSPYSTYIVLGDVAGDEKKEVITVDWSNKLHIWNLDGTPTVPPAPGSKAEGDGVVFDGLSGFAPPCLADLDGDGKAEILALSGDGRSVAAFRGNGRPFLSTAATSAAAAAADSEARKPRHGFLAWLPLGNAGDNCGVAAVDLGGEGVMDIFAGTQWIRLAKDGSTQATDMVPPGLRLQKDPIPPHLRAAVNAKRAREGRPPLAIEAPTGWSNEGGCSVVDIDGDGLAEVLFGLSDGRLFVYRTGMSLKARDAQWPTHSGSFQHTGTWARAK